jgi:NADH-quinone oxidoreductase subunit H
MTEIVVVTLIKTAIILFALLTAFAYLTLFERVVQARLQARLGPNRVGPFGLLQPAADGVKLLFKETSGPATRDRFLYLAAPVLSLAVAFTAFTIIPISGPTDLVVLGHRISWYVTNTNVGVLFYFALTSLGVYGIFLAGYASNSKYSLLGGLRSSAQMSATRCHSGCRWCRCSSWPAPSGWSTSSTPSGRGGSPSRSSRRSSSI